MVVVAQVPRVRCSRRFSQASKLHRRLSARAMAASDKPALIYFDAFAFGPYGLIGAVPRLFLLANDIPFEDKLITFPEWMGGEKARLKDSLESPLGVCS